MCISIAGKERPCNWTEPQVFSNKMFQLQTTSLVKGRHVCRHSQGPQTVRRTKYKCSWADWGRAVMCVCGDGRNWGRWWMEMREHARRDWPCCSSEGASPRWWRMRRWKPATVVVEDQREFSIRREKLRAGQWSENRRKRCFFFFLFLLI